MTQLHLLIIRLSLAFLWLFTAFTSAFLQRSFGVELLMSHGLNISIANGLVNLGSIVNLVLGAALLTNQRQKIICDIQVFIIISYTLILTYLEPDYWLHPFGILTKNIPILVLIFIYKNNLISKRNFSNLK